MKAYIGIDPGKSGGIAIIADGCEPWAVKMPETERDIYDTIRALRSWSDRDAVALIERVHSSPQMGVVSAFTFGSGYGALRMALIAAEIPFTEVTPAVWQKTQGCRTNGDKNISKARAQQLFPTLKITHATADALLIARHCQLINK